MFHRERGEGIRAAVRRYQALTTWSPLASGLLTGKYRNGVPPDSRGAIPRMKFLVEGLTDKKKNQVVGELEKVARELGCTLAQLSIAWCSKNPRVSTVITGASRVAQVEENLGAIEVGAKLTPAVMERIEALVEEK